MNTDKINIAPFTPNSISMSCLVNHLKHMKIIAKLVNYRLQENLIELVKKERIPHRIKSDRSIELSKKWENNIFDLCVEIMFDLFEQPSLFSYGKPIGYVNYIAELSRHNLPFYTFIINGEYTIVTSNIDSKYIAEHIRDAR